jgi:hypothetical protein
LEIQQTLLDEKVHSDEDLEEGELQEPVTPFQDQQKEWTKISKKKSKPPQWTLTYGKKPASNLISDMCCFCIQLYAQLMCIFMSTWF